VYRPSPVTSEQNSSTCKQFTENDSNLHFIWKIIATSTLFVHLASQQCSTNNFCNLQLHNATDTAYFSICANTCAETTNMLIPRLELAHFVSEGQRTHTVSARLRMNADVQKQCCLQQHFNMEPRCMPW